MSSAADAYDRLCTVLRTYGKLAIAVSGGVDSMTLAHVASRVIDTIVVHAISPAVPSHATERVRDHARHAGWVLHEADAGEFADPRYLVNPVNRCYFCKSNLYDRIAGLTDRQIASGANLDDLGDYRPGLIAARERRVVHPLIEAGIDKPTVRTIAARLDLGDLAELPAQPCLSSRVQTGIAIRAEDLAFIGRLEAGVRNIAPHFSNIRCRILPAGVVVEVDDPADASIEAIRRLATATAIAAGRSLIAVEAYRRGSAFLQPDQPRREKPTVP